MITARRRSRAWLGLAAAGLLLLSGCSLAFVRGPSGNPPTCAPSATRTVWPWVDVGFLGLYSGVITATGMELIDPGLGGAIFIAASVLAHSVSAWKGFGRVGACHAAGPATRAKPPTRLTLAGRSVVLRLGETKGSEVTAALGEPVSKTPAQVGVCVELWTFGGAEQMLLVYFDGAGLVCEWGIGGAGWGADTVVEVE